MSRRALVILLVAAASMCSLGAAADEPASPVGDATEAASVFSVLPSFPLLTGGELRLCEAAEGKPVVLRFWSAQCPHARSFDEQTQTLYSRFHPDALILDVNANWKHDMRRATRAREDAGLTFPMVIDSRGLLAKIFQVRTNAEFVLLDASHRLVYQGAYFAASEEGEESPSVEDLLAVLLEGGAPEPARTPAFGCFIEFNPIITLDHLNTICEASRLIEHPGLITP